MKYYFFLNHIDFIRVLKRYIWNYKKQMKINEESFELVLFSHQNKRKSICRENTMWWSCVEDNRSSRWHICLPWSRTKSSRESMLWPTGIRMLSESYFFWKSVCYFLFKSLNFRLHNYRWRFTYIVLKIIEKHSPIIYFFVKPTTHLLWTTNLTAVTYNFIRFV